MNKRNQKRRMATGDRTKMEKRPGKTRMRNRAAEKRTWRNNRER